MSIWQVRLLVTPSPSEIASYGHEPHIQKQTRCRLAMNVRYMQTSTLFHNFPALS